MSGRRSDDLSFDQLRRWPLVPVAAAFIAGILLARHAPAPWGLWAMLALAGLLTAMATISREHLHIITATALAVSTFSAGALLLTIDYRSVTEDHVIRSVGERSMPVTVRGRVTSSPEIDHHSQRMGYDPGPQTSFLLATTQIEVGRTPQRSWQAASGLLRVTVSGVPENLQPGSEVRLIGRIGRYPPPDNPGEFNARKRAQREGVLAWMTVPAVEGLIIEGTSGLSWLQRVYWRVRAAARQHVAGHTDSRSGQLVAAMVVGERDKGLRDLSRSMARAGTAHLLSISGLHMGIFLVLVFLLCRAAMLSVRASAMVVLCVLGAYVLLAQPRAPLLRSAVMAAMLCIGLALGRRYSAMNALAAAAIILLAADPMNLFDAGFQLSFAIVLGLLVLHVPVRNALFARFYRRRGLMVFRNSPMRRWAYYTAAGWGINIVVASVTAYVVAAPLVAYHFGFFSPYAPLLSVLLLPLVGAVLVPGYLALAAAPLADGLSYTLSRVASAAAQWLAAAVDLADRLPGLCLTLRPVSGVWVVACYATIALTFAAIVRKKSRRSLAAAAAAAGLILAALTVQTQLPARSPSGMELHLLAVGNGQTAVLRTPGGRTVLLDAGRLGSEEPWRTLIRPFLRYQRFNLPDAAFVSHANIDHYSALPAMRQECPQLQLYVNDYFGRDTPDRSAEPIEQTLLSQRPVRRVRAGTIVPLDASVRAEVLWPPEGYDPDLSSNDSSLVVRITDGGPGILLCGDIGRQAQRQLLAEGADLGADVLVLPHHGAWTTTLPEFVAAVDPQVVLVSGAGMLRGVQSTDPNRAEFFVELARTHRCYNTIEDGWICVESTGSGRWRVRTMRD